MKFECSKICYGILVYGVFFPLTHLMLLATLYNVIPELVITIILHIKNMK